VLKLRELLFIQLKALSFEPTRSKLACFHGWTLGIVHTKNKFINFEDLEYYRILHEVVTRPLGWSRRGKFTMTARPAVMGRNDVVV
jgi:hypothetical protein